MIGYIVVAVVSAATGAYVARKVTLAGIEAELKKIEVAGVADIKAVIAKIRAEIGSVKL